MINAPQNLQVYQLILLMNSYLLCTKGSLSSCSLSYINFLIVFSLTGIIVCYNYSFICLLTLSGCIICLTIDFLFNLDISLVFADLLRNGVDALFYEDVLFLLIKKKISKQAVNGRKPHQNETEMVTNSKTVSIMFLYLSLTFQLHLFIPSGLAAH